MKKKTIPPAPPSPSPPPPKKKVFSSVLTHWFENPRKFSTIHLVAVGKKDARIGERGREREKEVFVFP